MKLSSSMLNKLYPEKITIEKFVIPLHVEKGIALSALRLDKIHPIISGNKYFKLKHHLQYAAENKYEGILTFGGAWSNHIIATACAAPLYQLKSIGIIRGERSLQLSKTLLHAQEYGMQLEFVSRKKYNDLKITDSIDSLSKQFPGYYIIPEGGGGERGLKGAAEIMHLYNKKEFTHIVCATGTGTTFCGIANASFPEQKIIGIPVLKGVTSLTEKFSSSIINAEKKSAVSFCYEYHFGGFAKYPAALISFMNDFFSRTGIPTDFVYTGKLFFAVNELAGKKNFPPGSHILVIHSGGLQGNNSLNKGTLIF